MKRIIFCLGICVLLFTAAIYGQPPSAATAKFFGWAATDCGKRQETLAAMEAEAPKNRANIAEKEAYLTRLGELAAPGNTPTPQHLEYIMAATVLHVERDKEALKQARPSDDLAELQKRLDDNRNLMDFWTEYVSYRTIYGSSAGFKSSAQKRIESELTAVKERQTYVANQISLLRDQIPPGGCDQLEKVQNAMGTPGVKTVTVGPGVWVSTGIMLVKGQRFTIAATGTIKAKESPFTEWTPWGTGYYSLKGLIKDPTGANDQYMQLGSSHGDTARFDGELKLAATSSYYYKNGDPTHPEDQLFQGSYDVTITVKK